LNDDQVQDPTDNWGGNAYIPYFDSANGCFDTDTLALTTGVDWLEGKNVASVWNLGPDEVVIVHGDNDAYNVDNDNDGNYHQYVAGDLPPVLVANSAVGNGRVVYGGLSSTLSDNNYYGWLNSDIEPLVTNIINWLTYNVTDRYPQIEKIGHDSSEPMNTGAVTVFAEVSDDNSVCSVILAYSVNDGEERRVLMVDDGTGNYSVQVPAQLNGTVVKYHIEAIDNSCQVTFSAIDYYIVGDVHIVISELCYDAPGGDDYNEFIELYNPTGAELPLDGMKIETLSGGEWLTEGTIPEGETIPAYGFYLIGEDDVELADYSPGHIALGNSYGAVRITDAGTVIDKVGYIREGYTLEPDFYEGSPFLISATGYTYCGSLERKPGFADQNGGNWQDTDNNTEDFIENWYPEPQNTESPPEQPSTGSTKHSRVASGGSEEPAEHDDPVTVAGEPRSTRGARLRCDAEALAFKIPGLRITNSLFRVIDMNKTVYLYD
jgi:hypothetical protein